MASNSLYDQDFCAWLSVQAALLREGRLADLDADNLSEEIESIGCSQRQEVRRLARILQHLLKWEYQPELRSRGWSATLLTQRDNLAAVLEDSPSLRAGLAETLPRAYAAGRSWALAETGLLNLPATCGWTVEQVTDPAFLP